MDKDQVPFIDVAGKPFEHFERGVIYTAKRYRRGFVIVKKTYSNEKNLPVFTKAVKIED